MTETQEWVAHLGCQKLGNRVAQKLFAAGTCFCHRYPLPGGGLVMLKLAHSWAENISQVAFLLSLSIQDSFEKMNVQAVGTCHRNGLVKDVGIPTSMGTDHLRFFDVLWVFDGNTKHVRNKHKQKIKSKTRHLVMSFPLAHQLRSKNPMCRCSW